MANRDKAVRMAARGATPQQIRQAAGVTGAAARNIVNRATPAAPVTQQPQPYVSPYRDIAPRQIGSAQYGDAARRLQPFNNGGAGFGAAALQRARAAGISDADIKESLLYGGYYTGPGAFNDVFAKEAVGTPRSKTILGHDSTIHQLTGDGVQNWTADTIAHMKERRDLWNSLGQNQEAMRAEVQRRGWQDANSFASQGDLRMYTPYQPPSAPSSAPQPTSQAISPQSSTKRKRIDPRKLGQVLKIAGGGGGIGKRELTSILETGGKNVSGGQVVRRLDKINERLAAKDMTGINLKSGAANFLTRQAEKQGPGMDNFLGLGKSTFGTGRLGKALQGMVGTRETGGYINPQSGQQSRTPGTARTILPRGMDLMPSGRQTVRGIGKQFTGMPVAGENTNLPSTTATVTGGEGTDQIQPTEMLPEIKPEEEKAPQFGAGLSEALANWATGFKTARSSRKRSGPRAQGLGSQRVNPIGAFRGGM